MTQPMRVLLLPGWQNSNAGHWQRRWQVLHGFEWVEQSDWHMPRRGDWMARLDDVLLDDPCPAVVVDNPRPIALVDNPRAVVLVAADNPRPVVLVDNPRPVVLVAHSLGCVLVAAWAGHSQHVQRVRGALLVAPPDLQRDDTPPQLRPWAPVPQQRLPFPSVVVFSGDDPYCSASRAQRYAADWGAEALNLGDKGHINGDSGLGDWTQGAACLAAWGVALAESGA